MAGREEEAETPQSVLREGAVARTVGWSRLSFVVITLQIFMAASVERRVPVGRSAATQASLRKHGFSVSRLDV